MTLPELCECSENPESTMPDAPENTNKTDSATTSGNKLGKSLLGVLQQAASQGRATCSLGASVELLSSRPDDVMLCVMPALSQTDDVSAKIQSTLIRAVCQEHSILVVSVDCDVKLAKAVCMEEGGKGVDENCNLVLKTPYPCSEDAPLLISGFDNLAPVMGFPCVLVEFPVDSSPEDELVAEFCKKQLYGEQLTEPHIELPD
ncbi:hypothetical protein ACOMHN_055997 [Nucella lapillus]